MERFRINHPTGYVDVVVGEFFGSADDKKIRKLFRLARQHSTEADRAALAQSLRKEDQLREKVLAALEKWEQDRVDLLRNTLNHDVPKREPAGPEKRLARQRIKIAKVLEILENERWG